MSSVPNAGREELETASGPRFAIADAYTNAPYVLTDDSLGQQSVAAARSTIPDRPGHESPVTENRSSACGTPDPGKALDRRSPARGEMRIGEVENIIVS